MAHGNEMICQQVTLSGYAEWPKVADAVIEASGMVSSISRSASESDGDDIVIIVPRAQAEHMPL